MIANLKKDLKDQADPKRAQISAWFFKTQKGQYGYGDKFIGITTPKLRSIIKQYSDLKLSDISDLLNDPIHEYRLAAVLILVEKYKKDPEKIFNFYLKNSKKINNWDLVDSSAPKVVGDFLLNKDKKVLYKLAKSDNLWEKRIAIVSTYAFIKANKLEDTFKLAKILLNDDHDLMHKAVGWMLREAGKVDQKKLKEFLDEFCAKMPRTMLRYSIEKFTPNERKYYLSKK